MRILLVTHRYPPLGVTGVERLSEQTAMALTDAGHEVTVLTRNTGTVPAAPRLLRTDRRGIRMLLVSGGGRLDGLFPKHGPALDTIFERCLIEYDPDVVLISHLVNHSPTYVAIAERWNVPVVMEAHDFYLTCDRAHLQRRSGERCAGPEGGRACATYCFPRDRRALDRWALRTHMFRSALEHSDAVICPSRFVADYLHRAFGARLPPLHVIGNGVDVGAPRERPPRTGEDPLHLACVGVVAEHKGIHVALEALRLARLPESRLTLIGQIYPPYFRELRDSAELIHNLRFRAYGRFDPIELPFLLEDVDAVIVPSVVWETYSIAAREAMACGIPVIASRLGALPEAVRHGENGLLFEPGSAIELAAVLQMIDGDRGLLHALGAGIRGTDWISVAERTRLLQTVLEQAVAGTDQSPATVPEFSELSILRDALLEQPA